MKVRRTSALILEKQSIDQYKLDEIRADLTCMSIDYQTSEPVVSRYYRENLTQLILPRFYPLSKRIPGVEIIDEVNDGEDINIEHKIQLRSDVQKRTIDFMMSVDHSLVQLGPGVGKTVISIYYIAEKKKKAIILVHRNSLLEQWKNRLLEFTNLKDDEIGIVKSKNFETEMDKPILLFTNQSFLSLLKSENNKKFTDKLKSCNFGVFIADEAHTSIGAETFSNASFWINAKYNFGLSATPERLDGTQNMMIYHMGEIYHDSDAEGTMDARVTIVGIDFGIDIPKSRKYLYWDNKFQRSRYLTAMKKSEVFMNSFLSILNNVKDRNLLVMCERIKLIDDLYEKITFIEDKSKFCSTETLEATKHRLVLSTPGKCRDGVDIPEKDCLILTSPISNIEQVAGRITRSCKGKDTPIIIDFVDYGCKKIFSTIHSRIDYYEKKKWEIKYVIKKRDGKVIQCNKSQFFLIGEGNIQ